MALLGIQERRIGDDCIEVSFPGEATADAVERLEAAFERAGQERRHMILNFQGSVYIAPELVAVIEAGNRRLSGEGLDVLHFGASGIGRPILDAALRPKQAKDPDSRPSRRSALPGLTSRPAEAS